MSSRSMRRLRYLGLEERERADGGFDLTIRVEWNGEVSSHGVVSTVRLEERLRSVARATIAAAEAACAGRLRVTLLGIKPVRVFDGHVVVASLAAESDDRSLKLLGAQTADEGDLPDAAAKAVLDALNRVLGLHLKAPGT